MLDYSPTPLTVRAREVTDVVYAGQTLDDLLAGLAQRVQATVAEACEVGVVVLDHHGTVSSAATSSQARYLDQQQLDRGDGPVHAALTDGHTHAYGATRSGGGVVSTGLDEAHQLRTLVAVPLVLSSRVFGVISLYSGRHETLAPFIERTERVVRSFVSAAANAVGYATLERRAANLEQALGTRSSIECAKGIVMQREHCTGAQAFDKLRRQSQTRHVALAALAVQILASHEEDARVQPRPADVTET